MGFFVELYLHQGQDINKVKFSFANKNAQKKIHLYGWQ